MNPIDINAIEEREIVPGYRARFVHSDHMTLAFWNIRAGAPLPEHAHPHEQITRVFEGQFQLTVGGETHTLGPDMAMVIPGGVRHSAMALSACRLMDVFHPVREEYRTGN
jgi:quercetin dioxygenase-like cupin family protein